MIFNNATLLSLTKTSDFSADTVRYKSTKSLTIEGFLFDLANDNGVKDIWTDLKSFQQSLLSDWQDIIINDVNFSPSSRGIITNINFSEGNDVKLKTYTVEVTIPETGDLSTITAAGGSYSGLNFSQFLFIESFSESSDFSKSVSRDNYTQNISVTLKGPPTLNSINEAKTIATNFFTNNDLSNVIGDYSDYASTKKYFTENYNKKTFECSFSRTFELYKDSDGLYSLSRSHSINFDEAGVMSITESAEYIGNSTSSQYDTAAIQARTDIGGSFDRCEDIFNDYKTSDDDVLESKAISKSFNLNIFNNTVSYTIVYSNASRIGSAFSAFHDYTTTIIESENGTYNYSYEGSIVGYSEVNLNLQKYSNAVSAFADIKSNILTTPTAPIGTFKEVGRSETHIEILGKIDYSIQYSTGDGILNPESGGIRRRTTQISKDSNRFLNSTFNIIGFKEIVQIQENKLENTLNYSITLNGKANVNISTYINAAKSIVNSNSPSSIMGSSFNYLSDVNFSYDPFARQFNFNVSYFSLPS
jgi:hypothetical protein